MGSQSQPSASQPSNPARVLSKLPQITPTAVQAATASYNATPCRQCVSNKFSKDDISSCLFQRGTDNKPLCDKEDIAYKQAYNAVIGGRVQLGGRNAVVYQGPRGGKYVKVGGSYVALSKAVKAAQEGGKKKPRKDAKKAKKPAKK